MWILYKIAFAIFAFLIRLSKKATYGFFGLGEPFEKDGIQYYVKASQNKNVSNTTFSFKTQHSSLFSLTQESLWDNFFKTIGLAQELQTHDVEFDQKVYIASDSEAFKNLIQRNQNLRSGILSLFNMGCERISSDGTNLVFKFNGKKDEFPEIHRITLDFLKTIDHVNTASEDRSFNLRVILFEGLIWSLSAYAIASYLDFRREDLYLNPVNVYLIGACAGLAIMFALLCLIALFFRGSSRGHRAILESAVVFLVSLPVGGVALVSDVNIQLDQTVPAIIETKILNLYTERRHRRKGGSYTVYFMVIERPKNIDSKLKFPHAIELSGDTYSRLDPNGQVRLTIGYGRLGFPWYKSIEPNGY